jgi:hypothetical protein
VRTPTTADFRPPQAIETVLGIGAGLPARIDDSNKEFVVDLGESKLDDGVAVQKIRVGAPNPIEGRPPQGAVIFTIRKDDHTIMQLDLVVGDDVLYQITRIKRETVAAPAIAWDLTGLVRPDAASPAGSLINIASDMLVRNVSVEHMLQKASFKPYLFEVDPPWAGQREITDILDLPSPPNRMFCISYVAPDKRHVVLVQAATYNKMGSEFAKLAKVIYTSPRGVKVHSGPQDQWLAGILLQSARPWIKDAPSNQRAGYLLETPDGTWPALAINGKLSEQELHALIDSLAPAKPASPQ